jgi:arylsulfatase
LFARSTDPKEMSVVKAEATLPKGAGSLTLDFISQGPGKGATVSLSSGGQQLASLTLPASALVPAGTGESLDVGRDLGVPVTDYVTPNGEIEGEISHVVVQLR